MRNPCGLNLLSDWSISRLTQSSGREIEAKNVEIRSVTSRAEQRQYLPVGGGECNFFFHRLRNWQLGGRKMEIDSITCGQIDVVQRRYEDGQVGRTAPAVIQSTANVFPR